MPRLRPANTPFPGLRSVQETGFRSTGTCQNPAMDSTATTALDARVERVCRHLQASLDEPSLQELADIAGCSPTRLHRLFKQATGLTPKQYAAALRADRLRTGLEQQERITDAFHDAGFGSSGRFYENAPKLLGMTPKQWRAGGRGEVIHFALAESSLGSVLVASSATGVVAILLGDDPETLLQSLQQRFRQAELVGADQGYEQLVAQVVGLVEDPRAAPRCRWISAAPPSSNGYGRRCSRFRAGRPPRMRISPRASARRARAVRWHAPVQAIRWRWRCPATAWCAAMATCPAMPGA
jgi:AraC family transcriptional regulator of adaptative response/methylated-DNA-[protein]-cysteine methyltransferase